MSIHLCDCLWVHVCVLYLEDANHVSFRVLRIARSLSTKELKVLGQVSEIVKGILQFTLIDLSPEGGGALKVYM